MHPQQVCQQHQAVRCTQHAGEKGCHPEGHGQAQEVSPWEPHGVQQGQGQGPAHGWGNTHHPSIQPVQIICFMESSYPSADKHSHPDLCCLQLTEGALNPLIRIIATEQDQPQF